jgi:hypothetical protein
MDDGQQPISNHVTRRRLRRSIRRLLLLLKAGGDLRARKVRRIRAAVRAHHYDNDLKLSIALDRMLAEEQPGIHNG